MARKGHGAEQIVRKLLEDGVVIAEGMTTVEAARTIGVTEQT